jgi:hypothetical protein
MEKEEDERIGKGSWKGERRRRVGKEMKGEERNLKL